MAKPVDFDATFARLRTILEPHASRLVVVHDTPDNYYLDTRHVMPNGQPLFFGGVRRGRNYVSLYLMPVYVKPELLDGISPELRKRMQGKSCFNFKALDDERAAELEQLAAAGMEVYEREGYVGS
ncbi:MAG TPA: hypothetical protein VNA88_11270 [Candidatus Kapabacteria bacterium]|jgi:hypothetical protein|nr:hypothetical protein [Candidatus Kapabacteria bacterium]